MFTIEDGIIIGDGIIIETVIKIQTNNDNNKNNPFLLTRKIYANL